MVSCNSVLVYCQLDAGQVPYSSPGSRLGTPSLTLPLPFPNLLLPEGISSTNAPPPSGTLTTLQNNTPKAQHYPNIAPVTYKAFYTQFAAALRGEADVPVRPEEVREVIRIIELVRRSSGEGRTLEL